MVLVICVSLDFKFSSSDVLSLSSWKIKLIEELSFGGFFETSALNPLNAESI
jgi:hypothetical protein